MDIYRSNSYVRILYFAQPNKRTTLQYLPVTSPGNVGTNLLNAPWVNFPTGEQAPVNPPVQIPWEIRDYSITNRATNTGRIYRLRIT
jgi:hypothetical protein